MRSPFTRIYPVLATTDVAAAQAWYRDVLGFDIDWTDGDRFGQVSSGDVALFLERVDDGEGEIASQTVVLNCEDADAVFARVATAGATIVDPIATQPWGMREFSVADRDGHVLRIGHVDESAADYTTFEG